MYKSKENGKNQYLFCNETMKEELSNRFRLTADLYGALERNEFQLFYQPQVLTDTHRIISMESLIRWFHPEMGVISPGFFIPLAEQTGLIHRIGSWVLDTACKACVEIHAKGYTDMRISVNVSILQIRNPQFVDQVRLVLETTGLNPAYLELEVTESVAVMEAYDLNKTLEEIRALGVVISIDDFGTDYSSIGRLSTMPIDCVKLDMYFARSIHRSEKEDKVIRGL